MPVNSHSEEWQTQSKQNHICVDCGRQFLDSYDPPPGYSEEVKRECLLMYANGLGFRAIGSFGVALRANRVKGVHHTTVIYWLKQVGK